MGLRLFRKQGESLTLFIDPQISPEELHRKMQDGITVLLTGVSKSHASLKVSAPKCVHVIRTERFTQEQWLGRVARRPWWRRIIPSWLFYRLRAIRPRADQPSPDLPTPDAGR